MPEPGVFQDGSFFFSEERLLDIPLLFFVGFFIIIFINSFIISDISKINTIWTRYDADVIFFFFFFPHKKTDIMK